MGFRYQDLKDRGDSIELERKESFTTERNHNGYIKRRKTILRERFARPNAKEVQKNHKQQPQRSATPTAQPPAAESGRTATETIRNSPKSAAVVSTCRDRSHLERAVNRTSVQLKRLAHEIDNEIAKLKRERDKLMFRPRPYPLMRNAAIQNDIRVDEALPKLSLDQFNTIADNIEFTIEKFSSQHKFVCTSPRYARDEQTSCRPRMRTIGLQKDTRRSGIDCENFQNIKAKLDTAINYSATNLANLKATKGLLDPAPPNCYAFDYGGTGDGQKAMKVYHFQNCRCAGGFNQNESSCQKVCEHYNCVGNYNGTLCNKNTYVEKGVTPCSEYKYCRDEYRYDYPKQNNCVVPITNAPCTPCVPYQPCQPCVTYLPPCPTYSESRPAKPKKEVIYGRGPSDLNTNEFYHPTGASPRKRSPTKQHNARHSSNKERLTVDVPTEGRTFVDIERHGRAHSKSRRKKNDVEISKQRSFYQGSSPDKAMRRAHEHKSQGSADSSEKARQTKSNEKLLQITFTKERRHKNSLESGEEHMPYEVQASTREYSRETQRSMKKMTITAYKPCRSGESEDNSDEDRKKKQQRSKDRGGNSKYDDEKSWDERLRQTEDRPRLGDDWHVDVPTITEVYDNYRVGDAWIDEEDISATQPIGTLHVGGYRELIHIPQNRSYDIMPVPKDTVRDIPRIPSPNRGQRSKRDSEIAHRLRRADTRDRPGSVTGPDPLLRTQRDYTNGMKPDSLRSRNTDLRERPVSVGPGGQPRTGSGYTNSTKSDSFTAYGLTEKPRLYEMDRSYAFGDDDSSSHRDYERRTPRGDILDSQQNAYKKYEPDGPANKVHESKVQPAAGNGFSLDNTSRSAPDFQCKPDRMHGRDHSVISTPGGKLHSARDYGLDSKLRTGKINEADSLPMGALPPTDSLKSESKATPGIMEQSDSIHSGKRGKREAYGPGSKLFEEENDATETASIIYRPRKGEKTETYVDPGTSKTVKRTGKETESPREIPDSGQKFPTAMEVPEIKIEDLDDSGKSTRSGRYRGTDKLRQIEDHTEPGARVNGAPDTSSKPTTDSTTDKGGGRIDKSGAFDEQYGSGRKKGAAAPDKSQVLSPFPSLESPTIYMRPRETDYGSACLPSTSHCPKKTSPRVYCGKNAGDVYMCKSRLCSPQNVSPPSSPCRCLSPHRSGSEIPYEKLGDQYTHSPVRQLAANSHLAAALQPESATGYYIPSPQQQKSKSCLYLRSTGTQYSATIIENQDDRCAPQYVPLPKHCRQASVDEAKTSPSHFPSACASPCQDFKLACDSESPQNNNKFLCDEGDEEYKGKANFSNDQFSDSEKTQIIVAQEQEQRQQQQKVYSKGADHKNFYLPWQQDKKFVPGQPMSDCTMTSWQDESQSSLKSTKYQNAADRRPPRFNTNLQPHQEMPEEEARCAQEILQYEPQSRAQFVEQSSRQDAVRDPCCDEREEEISFQNEAEESMHECTPRGRSEFDDCREYQGIPEFTGCPCMFKTYLNMIALYYPEYRTQISDSDSVIEDAEL